MIEGDRSQRQSAGDQGLCRRRTGHRSHDQGGTSSVRFLFGVTAE